MEPNGEAPKAPGPLEQFDTSFAGINDRRGETYSHPSDNFRRITHMHEVIRECQHPLVRHALEQIAVKIARVIETPDHLDSLVDIAGYARTAAMVLDRESKL